MKKNEMRRSNTVIDINYNVVSWEISYEESNIILYNFVGQPNIVIYNSNSSCLSDLLKSFSTVNGKTYIEDDNLISIFEENNVTFEIREFQDEYSNRKYSISVYNKTELSGLTSKYNCDN